MPNPPPEMEVQSVPASTDRIADQRPGDGEVPVDVDADGHGRLLIVRDGPEREACPRRVKEPGHDGDRDGGDRRGGHSVGRDGEAVEGQRLLGKWQRHGAGDAAERERGGAADEGAEADRDHDHADQRSSDQTL